MKAKTLFYCAAVMSIALVGCKKAPVPEPTPEPVAPEELKLTADKTEEYAGGYITVTSSKPIKSFTAKDNLEYKDFELKVEKTSDNTLRVIPGSGSMRVSSSTARINSNIQVTVTDMDDQMETIALTGKSWFLDAKVGDVYGQGLAYTDVKAGDKVFLSVTSADAKNLTPDVVTLSFEGTAYKILEQPGTSKNYYTCEVKSGSSDYEIKAIYKARVVSVTPKSVK